MGFYHMPFPCLWILFAVLSAFPCVFPLCSPFYFSLCFSIICRSSSWHETELFFTYRCFFTNPFDPLFFPIFSWCETIALSLCNFHNLGCHPLFTDWHNKAFSPFFLHIFLVGHTGCPFLLLPASSTLLQEFLLVLLLYHFSLVPSLTPPSSPLGSLL